MGGQWVREGLSCDDHWKWSQEGAPLQKADKSWAQSISSHRHEASDIAGTEKLGEESPSARCVVFGLKLVLRQKPFLYMLL